MDPKDWNKMKKLLEDVADQETAQEILKMMKTAALGDGAQMKKYTNIETGAVSLKKGAGAITITGSGTLIIGYSNTNGSSVQVDCDGAPAVYMPFFGCVRFYFEESIKISSQSTTAITVYYIAQT